MSWHKHPANIARHDQQDWQGRFADWLTGRIGTLKFIGLSTVIIALWVTYNSWVAYQWFHGHVFDAFPFVFLNLAFSAFAFYSAPLILISQNRQTEHDRVKAEHDYETNRRTEVKIDRVMAHLGITDDDPGSENRSGFFAP
jgi:uncharacterized membrane protein